MDWIENYLISLQKQFQYYKMLGDKTFEQLNDDELFWRPHADSNSIAILVGHLWGNMKSRWTDFLNSDGEKEWRDRDLEFEAYIQSREELLEKWEEGWTCLFQALDSVNEENFGQIVYIRNMGHSLIEAFNRQLAHYSYHIGQIVWIAGHQKEGAWQSLSIPKGDSKAYNQQKFKEEKRRAHFSDEFLENTQNESDPNIEEKE